MNIFVLDKDPKIAAVMLSDQHVSKMILESAQMLSAVAVRWGHPYIYKPAYTKHPCTLWAGNSYANWLWLIKHALAMEEEKLYRTGKGHLSAEVVRFYQKNNFGPPKEKNILTKFAQAMPFRYKNKDPVIAYRNYYLHDKQFFKNGKRPTWTKREPPFWWDYK